MECVTWIALIIGLISLAILYIKQRLSFWQNLGVPTLSPIIPFGDTTALFLGRLSFSEQFLEFYHKFKAENKKFGGIYMGTNPVLVPIDPDFVKQIMQVDFQHFTNHGGYVNEKNDPLSMHLFNLSDTKWRNLRVKLTPTFTSGKMKMMFQTIVNCSYEMKNILTEASSSSEAIDVREVLGRFGTDVIGSVAFGLDINSLKNPDDIFRYYGIKASEMDIWDNIKIFMQVILPHKFLDAIGHKFTKRDVETFFMKVIKETVEYREKNKIFRKDFLHLLLQLKNRGTVADDENIIGHDDIIQEKALTINELAAQAFIFFMAGYETSSTTVTFTLYELAVNPDVQDKLRAEIKSTLAKHNNELTYECINEMTYLERVLFETLRKYPPLPILMRECSKDYIIPGTNIEIKKGAGVIIPVLGLQTDPDYYPDSQTFNPERFSEEVKKSRHPYTWLPFGEGPRLCIGMRFGILQSKVAIITFLEHFKLVLSSKTKTPLQQDKRSFVTRAKGGVFVNVEKI